MNIGVSFSDGIPILTLEGRFDGLGAKSFDAEALRLAGGAAYWVVDLSGVNYLSSLGVRSLLTQEKRLRLLGGGIVLTRVADFVQQVLRVSGLDGLLRVSPSVADAVALVRASVSAGPVVTHRLAGFTAKVQRLPAGTSTVEWWGGDTESDIAVTPLVRVSIDDLGFAFGTAILGEAPAESDGALGSFVSAPNFAGVLSAQSGGVSDFVVGDAARLVPAQVAMALGVNGSPACMTELNAEQPFLLIDAMDVLFKIVSDSDKDEPSVVGYVVIAERAHARQGVFVTGVAFDTKSARTIDRDAHLERWPRPIHLPSGRRLIGGAVTLEGNGNTEARTELADAIRALATPDKLRNVTGLDECGQVTRALIWAFVPSAVTSGAEKLLQVNIDAGCEWKPDWDAIVRRLYHDCRSVTLTPLHGGYMSKTFRAVAYDRDGRRTLPTVVKIGPNALTAREQHANREYVSRFILNNGTTVLGSEQHGEWAGLRYNFLGINGPDSELVWLREHYLKRPAPEMLGLLERLLTHVLKPWYGQPKWEQVSLYRDHTPLRLFPNLIEVAERELRLSADAPTFDCAELGVELPNPFHFLKHEYPRRGAQARLWYTAISHGDLNLQNVLVDERDNLYVIDFSETRPRNIVSDFARMEPIFKFEMTRMDSDEDLQRLVEFEEGLMSVTRLDEPPPFRYHGNDPMVERAHAGITLLRRCADRATLFEQDIVPYWIAMLEWTYSVVGYSQVSLRHKRYAACSAALICRSIRQLEGLG